MAMPLTCALSFRVLALFAAVTSGPALAAPPIQSSPQPIRHEITGSGSGDLDLVLKRYQVPPEIRAIALRSFAIDQKFSRKLPKNSSFQVIYESTPSPSADEKPQQVLRSIWVNAGGSLFDLYRYSWRGVTPVYLNQNGRSIRELELRVPVDDARLTSKFGWREHPIFKTRKFHYGLDLAAPIGTPVRAAADGFVVIAGLNGNYGNYVRIDHGSHLATGYAHLSSIVSTLRPGKRVTQGQIIGFVGMTGLATGPHLCFQLLQDDKQLNPLTARPMIEEDVVEQLANNPGSILPTATIGELQ
jgi:murein DD-endopeptidase MepM/ murein hydrolase activator NlpD